MRVLLPTMLRSYSHGATEVAAEGEGFHIHIRFVIATAVLRDDRDDLLV